ncbi:MAG: putative bifunctional diguanylate cyclase/phosphodiesterase [Acidimicrobiia bacterium]
MTTTTPSPLRRALYRALHDPLTGLANRALVLDRISCALARLPRTADRRAVAVVLLDLDRFRLLNDGLGHHAGDDVLVEVARRLESAARSTDLVGRVGGDEFVVVAEDVASEADALALAHRLREVVAAPLALPHGEVVVATASAGIVVAGASAASAGLGPPGPTELLWDAEAAMYRAKEHGRDGAEVFRDGLRAPALDRFRAEAALRAALEHDHLLLHYPPIFDHGTGALVGVEALVRLHDPERGLVPPGEFIAAAEDSGLIVPLGSWVIAEAARQAARWDRRSGGKGGRADGGHSPPLVVSVNVSGRQLTHPAFLAEVSRALAEAGVDLSVMCFEITENALLEASGSALRSLCALREQGARLAIDDFGTGHSSLTWLRRLPVDVLKIDRSFVAGVGDDADDAAIVRAVVGLGHALGLITVAEGVETTEQRQALRDMGCEWAQGFLIARPGPAASLAGLVDNRT